MPWCNSKYKGNVRYKFLWRIFCCFLIRQVNYPKSIVGNLKFFYNLLSRIAMKLRHQLSVIAFLMFFSVLDCVCLTFCSFLCVFSLCHCSRRKFMNFFEVNDFCGSWLHQQQSTAHRKPTSTSTTTVQGEGTFFVFFFLNSIHSHYT